jgi:3-keto-disaccharide hydrolase
MNKPKIMKDKMRHSTPGFIRVHPLANQPAPSNHSHDRLKRRLAWGLAAGLALLATRPLAAQTPPPETGFVSLFDGKTLNGWKVGDNAEIFHVQDGMIVMSCPANDHRPAHLFYEGDVSGHTFKNFDLRVDVLTYHCANSGIYFHTRFQNAGFPRMGLECQVDNSHVDWRRTGSLYGLFNLTWGPETPAADNKQTVIYLANAPVRDNVWYTQEIICRNGVVTVKLNRQPMFTYQIAHADVEHRLSTGATWLPEGTFALQGHPPMSGQISKTCFRNIRVKVLPD